MKSPFPGMDPYIEACGLWRDFHSHLIEKIGEKLADLAPQHHLVRTGERSYAVPVESEAERSYSFVPDFRVSAPRAGRSPQEKAAQRWQTPQARLSP